jgi:hypothetical protein
MIDFLRRLFSGLRPVAPVPAPTIKAVTKTRRPRRKHPWLNRAIAGMRRPGNYEVEVPASVAFSHGRALLCQRLTTRFGKGSYATRQIGGSNKVAVIILE